MYYRARYLDNKLGRFISADSVTPPGVIGLDRYAYARNSSVNYTDPSGHYEVCDEGKCEGLAYKKNGNPFSISPDDRAAAKDDELGDAVDRGVSFVEKLRKHKGWWTQYLEGPEPWKFLLTLAFLFESYSYKNMNDWSDFKIYMTDSIINKAGDYYKEYGVAGLYAYLGGREALFEARGQIADNDPRWKQGTAEYLNTWDFDYLGMGGVYDQAKAEMEKAWPLVSSYTGSDLYGTGAWDYGITPPQNVDENKIIWKREFYGYNAWLDTDTTNEIIFISK